jgi:hypothetical protein
MKNNAHISITLSDLLDGLDARKTINIFISEKESVKFGYVYEVLTDKDFISVYGDKSVIGISGIVGYINILIEEA